MNDKNKYLKKILLYFDLEEFEKIIKELEIIRNKSIKELISIEGRCGRIYQNGIKQYYFILKAELLFQIGVKTIFHKKPKIIFEMKLNKFKDFIKTYYNLEKL